MELKVVFLISLAFVCIAQTFGHEDEIYTEILVPPPADCQRKTKIHDQVAMAYIGTLSESGVKFDSSFDRGKLFEFQIGAGQAIQGWEEGLLDMCVGEKRKLLVPASKGYGARGVGGVIPPNADLTFEVELMHFKDGTPPPNVFKAVDENGDWLLSQDEVSDYLKRQPDNGESADEQKHNDLVASIFTHEDKDKDGFISFDEFSGPKHDEL